MKIIEQRIDNLTESAKEARNWAAFQIGIVAVGGTFAAVGGYVDSPGLIGFGGLAVAISAASGVRECLLASSYSQKAAALEGAMALHELQAPVLFDQEA